MGGVGDRLAWVDHIEIGRAPRPAISMKRLIARRSHEEAAAVRLSVDAILRVSLEVWVGDRDEPAPLWSERIVERRGVGEERAVPRKVALPVRVLDVEPENVERAVEAVGGSRDPQKLLARAYIPVALVVAERP